MASHAERLNEIADWLDLMGAAADNVRPHAGRKHADYAASLRAAAEAFEKLGHAEDCAAWEWLRSVDHAGEQCRAINPDHCTCPQSEDAS